MEGLGDTEVMGDVEQDGEESRESKGVMKHIDGAEHRQTAKDSGNSKGVLGRSSQEVKKW